jgi:hypothetical protein
VPKQSSSRNKDFFRDITICVLLFLSDRCTHALPPRRLMRKSKLIRSRTDPSSDDSQGYVQLHSASKESDGVLKVAVANCGEPDLAKPNA